MTKTAAWIWWSSIVLLTVNLILIGIKLLNGNDEFSIEAWMAAACWIVVMTGVIVRVAKKLRFSIMRRKSF